MLFMYQKGETTGWRQTSLPYDVNYFKTKSIKECIAYSRLFLCFVEKQKAKPKCKNDTWHCSNINSTTLQFMSGKTDANDIIDYTNCSLLNENRKCSPFLWCEWDPEHQ